MAIKTVTATTARGETAASVDPFEQTWDRYIKALDEMRNLIKSRKENFCVHVINISDPGRVEPDAQAGRPDK